MALYDGVPSIRLEGDEQRALALIPEAKALLYRTQEVIKNAGVSTYSMYRNVEDGYIRTLCAHGQNIIYISVAADGVDETYEGKDYPYSMFPDFYSGIVTSLALQYETITKDDGTEVVIPVCPGFSPTPDCIASHPKDRLVPGRQRVSRLAVEPHAFLSELKNEDPMGNGPKFHQYGKLRSSMYSGMMRKVVQIVMGLGKIGVAKMRDPNRPGTPDSDYLKSIAGPGVQVRYDYKFYRTHGITVADDGRLWLVEISSFRGVIAMPLPLFPRSTSEGFKERARARKDDAMVFALEELGGLPTGESFSFSDGAIEAEIAKGNILRLLTRDELSEFYDFMGYSSAQGWAFSPDGREAHNTGWKIGDDKIQTGAWYQINIRIGATNRNRRPGQPIAEGSANLRKVREGRIYCHPKGPAPRLKKHFLPFKYYEPLLEGLISHEGVPAGEPEVAKLPVSDTPVFVCFVDGTLKVVFYYHDPEYLERGPRKTMAGEFGRCLLAGEWELVQGEKTRLPRMMYTNEYDYRREIQSNFERETLESIDLGYKAGAAYSLIDTDHWFAGVRFKGFSNKYTRTVDITESVIGAVLVPRYSREAFYFATADWEGKFISDDPDDDPGADPIQTQHRDWQFNIRDPHMYSMFRCGTYGETNFFAMPDYIAASVPNRLKCRAGVACPFVPAGADWNPPFPQVIDHYYSPTAECAEEYADEGPWLDSCEPLGQPSDVGMTQWPVYDNTYYTTYPFKQSCALYLVTQGHNGPIQIDTTVQRVGQWWNNISPDIWGNYQQITVTHSAIGEDCVVYDTAPHDDPTRTQKITGYLPDEIPQVTYPTFVGVNIA
jgi:hypothetical protein